MKLDNSGYHISEMDGSVVVNYAVGISNSNEEYAVEFPKVQITAKDKDDKVLGTEEMVLPGIAAGDDYIWEYAFL